MLASASIRSETDDQSDDLLSFDPEDLTEEAEARNWLDKAKTSLETPVQVTTNGFDHPVYLGALFEPPYIDRTYLPSFLADNEVVLNSFPDPTFSGLLPDFTQENLFADTLPPDDPGSMAPSGGAALVDRTPLLTWSDPLLNASWFQVVVSGPNGTILNRWLEDAQVQMAHLGPGNYSWWVRSWNEHGYSGWSGAAKFSIVLSPPPSPPTVLGQIGQQPLGDRRPQFSWDAVDGAAWYRVWVSRVGKGFYVERWVQAPATDWPADRDFAGGDYRWWIVAWNPDGYGPWSGGTDFAIPLLKPGKIVLNSPTGGMDLAGGNVTYEWEADERATWYRLWSAKDGKAVVDRWYAAGDVVSGATASADIGGHRWGKYTWYACGWGADGLGTWSDGGTFICGRPTPLSGSATALVWDDTRTMTADWYHFWLQNTDNGAATSFWLQRGNTTDAGGGQRSIVINPQLTPANYTWYIRAWSSTAGMGPWSDGYPFTVL